MRQYERGIVMQKKDIYLFFCFLFFCFFKITSEQYMYLAITVWPFGIKWASIIIIPCESQKATSITLPAEGDSLNLLGPYLAASR